MRTDFDRQYLWTAGNNHEVESTIQRWLGGRNEQEVAKWAKTL